LLKRGVVYNYTCELNSKCAKNCYVILKNKSSNYELYLCTEEEHDHDISDLTKRRKILIDMFAKNNFSLQNVNNVLSNEGLTTMDKYNFSNFKHRIKNKLKL